jgi:EAL domain-containing protein (putative c-di-GMP-specific phosphodiesterase class I)
MKYLFVAYISTGAGLQEKESRPYLTVAAVLLIVFSAADTVWIFSGPGLRIVDGTLSFEGSLIFTIGYILFAILLGIMLLRVRHRLYSRVMSGFFSVVAICVVLLATARLLLQSTYTVTTFLLPMIAIMYLIHSNPYDATLGANDLRGLNNLIRYSDEKGKNFLFLSLYIRELDESGKTMSDELRTLIRHAAESYYRRSTLFQVSNGHVLLIVPKDRNRDYEERTEKILDRFRTEYPRFRYDYKFVIGESSRELSRKNVYTSFIRSIHARIPENTVYRAQPEDLNQYKQYETILKELADIAEKKDPEDPRVLVYCQPVYNLRTGKYDTAEALMRLQNDELGIVFPDRFIPLAEENGYIHALTEIILNKTCRTLHRLVSEGYEITRISVNVSVMELRDPGFCGDIRRIIDTNNVDSSRIAIELTESRNDSDFILMKERIEELRKNGIDFYLDDFGTGYSNMERILELPFDIIKFDRSIVTAGRQNKRSEQVLGSMAELFSKLRYSVLYEGIEDEVDEAMCRGLNASYLQGYKYSRPIPIGELSRFLIRSNRETERLKDGAAC